MLYICLSQILCSIATFNITVVFLVSKQKWMLNLMLRLLTWTSYVQLAVFHV